jgi:hypothetical protein
MFSNYVKVVFKKENFRGQTQYEFVNFIEDLQVGDVVLVRLTREGYNGFDVAIAQVAQINTNGKMATSYVIERICDLVSQEKMRQFNKKKEIEQKMEQRFKELKDIALYRQLATSDEKMKELMMEYENLTKRD